jgi:hypothetical protein
MPSVTVDGTIARVYWSPDTPLPGQPGRSGSLGRDRVDPAHFRVQLERYRGLDAATAWRLNGLVGETGPDNEDRSRPPARLFLKLNHEDPHALRPGMRIRVRGYSVSGDEGGTWTDYQHLDILSRPEGSRPASN